MAAASPPGIVTFVALVLASCTTMIETTGGGPGASGSGASGTGTTGGGAGAGGTGDTVPPPPPFEALPPNVYASKVKNLLTGMPLTSDELTAVVADPNALRGLVEGWMALPQWRSKQLDFFKQAFQQTQISDTDLYTDIIGRDPGNWASGDQTLFMRSVQDSFARTVLALLDAGRPFTETVTTDTFMLNPPLMAALAYMDAVPRNDQGRTVTASLWLTQKYPSLTFARTANIDPTTLVGTPIPIEETLDPASPNFMRWYDPTPYTGTDTTCMTDPYTRTGTQAVQAVFDFIFGGRPGCGRTVSQWTADDWASWRMVRVRPPAADEERTTFWDIPKLRDPNTTELVLATPRVGFMTTPAFMVNWPTNPSNSYRVTINQTMIVALGKSFDDRATTVQVSESADDSMHVQPGTACYGCHQTLDPMRDFFRQSYSIVYSQQLANPTRSGIPATATFSVDGVPPTTGTGVFDLAHAIAAHPRFPVAWTQKLCQYANSESCLEDDAEFQRVVQVFIDSGFQFNKLVAELFTSPLVTFAAATKTAEEKGVTIGISRREPLCAAIENRLAIPDVCGLRGEATTTSTGFSSSNLSKAKSLASSIPGAGYARGDDKPLLPHDPDMFFTAATDNLCGVLAAQLVDVTGGAASRYSSADPDTAIADMVATVMGVPPADERSAELTQILQDHFAEARALKVNATNSLRSTFILACSSPLGISLGL